jgi:hypothetical protein
MVSRVRGIGLVGMPDGTELVSNAGRGMYVTHAISTWTATGGVSTCLCLESSWMGLNGDSRDMVLLRCAEHGASVTGGRCFPRQLAGRRLDLFCGQTLSLRLSIVDSEVPRVGGYAFYVGSSRVRSRVVAFVVRHHLGTYEGSYVGAGSLFIIASIQWLILGRALQRRFWHGSC